MNIPKIPYTSAVFMFLGTLFSFIVASQGVSCYGMSCLGFSVSGFMITIGGYPWSLLDGLLIPERYYLYFEIEGALVTDPILQLHLWPKFIIRYLAFMLNLFILGYIVEKSFRFLKKTLSNSHRPNRR